MQLSVFTVRHVASRTGSAGKAPADRTVARTRRTVACLCTVVALGALTGCGGNDLRYEPAIGSNARTASIQALSLAVVTNGHGVGTLAGTLINEADGADRLLDVRTTSEIGPIGTTLPDGPVALPHEEPVRLATTSAVMMRSDNLRQGYWIDLVIRFDDSSELSMKVPVEPQSGPYADIEITQSPDGDVAP